MSKQTKKRAVIKISPYDAIFYENELYYDGAIAEFDKRFIDVYINLGMAFEIKTKEQEEAALRYQSMVIKNDEFRKDMQMNYKNKGVN